MHEKSRASGSKLWKSASETLKFESIEKKNPRVCINVQLHLLDR